MIEVIIVVVIVAILATIAIPQYQQYVRKSNRAVATGHLQTLVGDQEAYALQHRSQYATTLKPITGMATPYFVGADGMPTATQQSNSLFRINLKDASASSYTLVAESVGAQKNDACTAFYIAPDGRQWANKADWSEAKKADDPGCWS